MADRAVRFIDGNNWYHSIREAGVEDRRRLNYAKISRKLIGPREWHGTRYYIGRVRQTGDTRLYADQRSFLDSLSNSDPLISTHLGRLEKRPAEDPAAVALRQYLANLPVRIDRQVYHDLMGIAREHHNATVVVEKAVDVMLAVDMVVMAERDKFDAAYLLSADGDFTPAVEAIRQHDKKVYAVSPATGPALKSAANAFIRLPREWFDKRSGPSRACPGS